MRTKAAPEDFGGMLTLLDSKPYFAHEARFRFVKRTSPGTHPCSLTMVSIIAASSTKKQIDAARFEVERGALYLFKAECRVVIAHNFKGRRLCSPFLSQT